MSKIIVSESFDETLKAQHNAEKLFLVVDRPAGFVLKGHSGVHKINMPVHVVVSFGMDKTRDKNGAAKYWANRNDGGPVAVFPQSWFDEFVEVQAAQSQKKQCVKVSNATIAEVCASFGVHIKGNNPQLSTLIHGGLDVWIGKP